MKHAVVGIISKTFKGVDKYLLVSSVLDYGEFTGYYYPPGGHLEKGKNLKQALAEKIKKELFIDVIPIKEIAETPSDVKNQVIHWWLCKAKIEWLSFDKGRLSNAKWFSEEEIKSGENIWPASKKFFQECIFR